MAKFNAMLAVPAIRKLGSFLRRRQYQKKGLTGETVSEIVSKSNASSSMNASAGTIVDSGIAVRGSDSDTGSGSGGDLFVAATTNNTADAVPDAVPDVTAASATEDIEQEEDSIEAMRARLQACLDMEMDVETALDFFSVSVAMNIYQRLDDEKRAAEAAEAEEEKRRAAEKRAAEAAEAEEKKRRAAEKARRKREAALAEARRRAKEAEELRRAWEATPSMTRDEAETLVKDAFKASCDILQGLASLDDETDNALNVEDAAREKDVFVARGSVVQPLAVLVNGDGGTANEGANRMPCEAVHGACLFIPFCGLVYQDEDCELGWERP